MIGEHVVARQRLHRGRRAVDGVAVGRVAEQRLAERALRDHARLVLVRLRARRGSPSAGARPRRAGTSARAGCARPGRRRSRSRATARPRSPSTQSLEVPVSNEPPRESMRREMSSDVRPFVPSESSDPVRLASPALPGGSTRAPPSTMQLIATIGTERCCRQDEADAVVERRALDDRSGGGARDAQRRDADEARSASRARTRRGGLRPRCLTTSAPPACARAVPTRRSAAAPARRRSG